LRNLFLIFLLFLSHCSIDSKSGIWENKNEPFPEKKIIDIKFNDNLTFEEFKENVIKYGELSKIPILDE